MKISESNSNVGVYYGNDENGQWQPNGVIVETGVPTNVVGAGDAGVVHYPPRHDPGYTMAGYYSVETYPAAPADDFEDYMWMENEDEFDKQVMQQLEEEALMEQCIEAMLEDEQRERHNGHRPHRSNNNRNNPSLSLEETVSRSTLNPLAAEFVPTFKLPTQSKEDKEKVVEVPSTTSKNEESTEPVEVSSTDNHTDDQSDTPEVSAADVQPTQEKSDKRPKETKKDVKPKTEQKKPPLKAEVKKTNKPQTTKSEPKVPGSKQKEVKKDVKTVKSEERVESVDSVDSISVDSKSESPIVDDNSGPKPINYAAAARAMKPKKATTPPATDKPTQPTLKLEKSTSKTEKVEKPKSAEKPIAVKDKKTEKPRKNSAK